MLTNCGDVVTNMCIQSLRGVRASYQTQPVGQFQQIQTNRQYWPRPWTSISSRHCPSSCAFKSWIYGQENKIQPETNSKFISNHHHRNGRGLGGFQAVFFDLRPGLWCWETLCVCATGKTHGQPSNMQHGQSGTWRLQVFLAGGNFVNGIRINRTFNPSKLKQFCIVNKLFDFEHWNPGLAKAHFWMGAKNHQIKKRRIAAWNAWTLAFLGRTLVEWILPMPAPRKNWNQPHIKRRFRYNVTVHISNQAWLGMSKRLQRCHGHGHIVISRLHLQICSCWFFHDVCGPFMVFHGCKSLHVVTLFYETTRSFHRTTEVPKKWPTFVFVYHENSNTLR